MLAISSEELAELREAQESAMPERVTIKRSTRTQDGMGQLVENAAAVVAADVPARISPSQVLKSGGEAARDLEVEKWQLRFPHGTDVKDRDLIVWGTVNIIVDDVKQKRSWHTAISAAGEIVKGS